jgi:type VI secretion system (T6SS) effector TldE1-like protein
MFVYIQSNGKLYYQGPGYTNFIGKGYSGYGAHRDNPESQCAQDLGPIPRGDWTMSNLEDFVTSSGQIIPDCIRLTPAEGTNTCNRSGFWIHGGNSSATSSQGCIVLTKAERLMIGNNPDKTLRVIANQTA